ncbi:MAG: 7TM diverse intracellular signaling domain-containing protein [Spirochaetota bacterium]
MAAGLAIVLPARLCLQMTYALLMAFATLVIIHTGNAFRRGNRFARYFLSGMGGVALFTVVGTLTAFGRLPLNFFTEWSTELGFLWLVFSASAGMIDRMKVLADDLRSSRAEQEKNIELLTRANQELAATNEELNAAMEELSATNEEFEAQNEELIAAENDLKRSEEKYRNLVENINEVILLH